jgi:DNA-binding NtrC family response regulator
MLTSVSDGNKVVSDQITQATARRETSRVPIQGFTLQVEVGADQARALTAEGDRISIGTHPSNPLVLTDPSVSRFHCEIGVEGNAVRIRDTGSLNGTRVDGVAVIDAFLRDGSAIELGESRLRFRLLDAPQQVAVADRDRFGRLVGSSLKTRALFAKLELAAASDITVLVTGETGTGKELAAESLHRESARREGPFVVVDCGAIPRDLLESELFGHRKGSFTGAVADRDGAFFAAAGGTVFLDEIGELPLDLQPKLLRVLDQRAVRRVGDTRYLPVDVRVVAATNRDLRAEVNAHRFRPDLYYRLAVLELHLPSLRERLADLPLLVDNLLAEAPREDRQRLLSAAFLAELEQHPWPGNVRELRNYLERCLVMQSSLPVAGEGAASTGEDFREARAAWTRGYLVRLLGNHDGNVAQAARAAGLDRIHLYRLLRSHGVK